ncbi:fumarylacetoacetate hydrolase family protein [Pseudomonas tolaasii]|uniref:Fumarylacetoacetate hydrolase family protein n=2 Tax=Pseudomonas tolaasii TaxID=29442 RepID=A0A7Y8AI98_PSETO|nr:fumarylacetoacetate hydrolase family protein [Pseudomonas tolaasii]ARB27984.1 hydrolase [Pseudomonas tolaasii]KAB0468750.1 fumarylacetoacetate hydrolase family protein [Pseudomonas tolaasii]MBW1249161.1 fumarylacetoacetate hydrolase family protein [Pseudomonas tolaasii]MBY8941782.1 fumarylacetoacetate hydrolase family protein [Pseudomonas tolaasii]NWC23726.1 fumarylacetoacetate hydrolase family protein [Pseudomonas tolaasii]
MKLATLENAAGERIIAIVNSETERFWPVSELVSGFTGDMNQLVLQWDQLKSDLVPRGEGQSLENVTLKAPLLPRRNLFCVGKNYHEHAAEFSKSGFDHSAKDGEIAPEFPVVFTKTPDTVIATGDKIPRHADVTNQLDYEAEFAVIIGKGGRGISKVDAYAHVFGYTIVNDMTARDLQKNHRQWFLGKSLDGFAPMGPWISTPDEVNVADATIQCWVNGELRQNANIGQLIFDIPHLIETISAGIELKPGDVIVTGTPVGVGIGFTPPRFLQSGDVVRIEIAGIGALENEVAE